MIAALGPWLTPPHVSVYAARSSPSRPRMLSVMQEGMPFDDDESPDLPYDDEDETAPIKRAIALAHRTGDRTGLLERVAALEALNPIERCATSPLLDGHWATVVASPAASWARGSTRIMHVIESWSPPRGLGPGAPGVLASPSGALWADVAEGRGAYVQRARLRFGSCELRATYRWLGGENWDVEYVSRARLLLGLPLWKRRVEAWNCDLDHAVRPTFVDGDCCILRAPAVTAGADVELRPERVWMLRRLKNRLWQDSTFVGLSDRPLAGFDLDP